MDQFRNCDLYLTDISKLLNHHWIGHSCQIGNYTALVEKAEEDPCWHQFGASFKLASGLGLKIKPDRGTIEVEAGLHVLKALRDTLQALALAKEAKQKIQEPPKSLDWDGHYYANKHIKLPETEVGKECLERLTRMFADQWNAVTGQVELKSLQKHLEKEEEVTKTIFFFSDSWGNLHVTEDTKLLPITILYQPPLGGVVLRLRPADENRLPLLTTALEKVVSTWNKD